MISVTALRRQVYTSSPQWEELKKKKIAIHSEIANIAA
jgi:hypothetical protein